MSSFDYVRQNYINLLSEIDELGKRVGREITLVAVTKSGSDEELMALAEAGVTDIGENRPGELRRRGDLLSEAGYSPRLHEIGNLQRNKVRLIIEKVDLIHSLDSLPLAEEIEKWAKKIGRTVRVLIEINSGREVQKGGVMPEEAEEFFLALTRSAGMTLHIRQLDGTNSHHILEAMFKALGRALSEAAAVDARLGGEIPSTKGVLA